MESRICLIRHGITEGNKNRLYYGFSDIPLAEEGIAELTRLAESGIYPYDEDADFYTTGLRRTEQTLSIIYGEKKHSHIGESGKIIPLEGTAYRIKCVELGKYVSKGMKNAEGDVYATDRDGKVTIEQKLQAGNYILEEIKAPKGYVVAKEHLKFMVDGTEDKLDVIQKNVPQKGIITINKMGEYKYKESWSDIREKAMGGIDFDIVALADIITPDGTVRAKKGDVVDTVRTDFKGNVSSDKLYLGPYNVVEKDAPVEYRISEPINVALVYSNQDEEVIEKKVNVFNRLKRTTDSIDNSPRTGDESNMNSVLFIMFISLTVMLVVAVASKVRRS